MKSCFARWGRIPWTLLSQSSWRHMFTLWITLSLCKTLPQIVTMTVISVIFGILFNVRYLLVALFLGAYVWAQCTSYYRLSNFRGPFWASITNLWMVRSVYLRRAHLDLYHAYQKYGSDYKVNLLIPRALIIFRWTYSYWAERPLDKWSWFGPAYEFT